MSELQTASADQPAPPPPDGSEFLVPLHPSAVVADGKVYDTKLLFPPDLIAEAEAKRYAALGAVEAFLATAQVLRDRVALVLDPDAYSDGDETPEHPAVARAAEVNRENSDVATTLARILNAFQMGEQL